MMLEFDFLSLVAAAIFPYFLVSILRKITNLIYSNFVKTGVSSDGSNDLCHRHVRFSAYKERTHQP